MSQAARVQASGLRNESKKSEKLERLLIELTNARDLAHAVPDGAHIIYMIEMALLEVADRSRAASG